MRKSLYFAVMGLILMMTGVITTYVAFGQTASGEVAEATLTMTPTLTPVIEQEVVQPTTAVENVQPIQPTVVVVPTEIPASPIPTEVPLLPTVEIPPTQVIAEATPTEIIVEEVPVVEPTLAEEPTLVPTEIMMDTASAESSELTPTVEVVQPVVEATPTEIIVEEAPVIEPTLVEEPTLVPTELVAEDVPAEETTARVEPTPVEVVPTEPKPDAEVGDSTPVGEALDTTAAVAPPDATPQLPVAEDPLFTPTVAVEEQPVTEEITATLESELPGEGLVTMVPTEVLMTPTLESELVEAVDEAALEAVVTLGLVSGQVNMTHRVGAINLLLTLPDGTIQESITDEAGSFIFEELLPGDYGLTASAPGFLAKAVEFSLIAGEELALPATALNAGDLNQDNQIDLSDVVLIAANYNGPAVVIEADLNGDEWIDISDLTIIGARFGLSGPTAWE